MGVSEAGLFHHVGSEQQLLAVLEARDGLGDPALARLVASVDGLQVPWLLDPSIDVAADLELLLERLAR